MAQLFAKLILSVAQFFAKLMIWISLPSGQEDIVGQPRGPSTSRPSRLFPTISSMPFLFNILSKIINKDIIKHYRRPRLGVKRLAYSQLYVLNVKKFVPLT